MSEKESLITKRHMLILEQVQLIVDNLIDAIGPMPNDFMTSKSENLSDTEKSARTAAQMEMISFGLFQMQLNGIMQNGMNVLKRKMGKLMD